MEQLFFETSKKAPKKRLGKRPLGRVLRFLRFLFNLVLIFVVSVLAIVSSLYAYVVYVHGDQLEGRYPDLVENSSVYDAEGH